MITLLFFIFSAHAEYRAFELNITNASTNQSRVVLSTLDHLQYPMYYPLQKDERIQITSTWMCRNRTDQFQPICDRPTPPVPAPSTATAALISTQASASQIPAAQQALAQPKP